MRRRVGLAITHDTVRAVVVKRSRLLWAGEASREPGAPTVDDIVTLLARAPRPRWRRLRVAVAIGPHAAQLKRIAGLPPVDDAAILAAVVRENAGTFFLQNGATLAVTGIRRAEPGTVWAGAIEATYIACVRQACRKLRLKLCSIAPAAVVLPLSVRSESFQWSDGPVTVDVACEGARLASVRRVSAGAGKGVAPPEPPPALQPLGERAAWFADAYGAAIAPGGDPLTLGPKGDVPWERRRLRRRLLPPALLACAAAVALLLSPLYPQTLARRAESSLRALQASDAWRLTNEVLPQLERATVVLAELEQFAAARPQRTRLLADLATALPAQTALVRFEIADDVARVMVLGPRAQEAIAAVEKIPGITAVTLSGAVARQHVAGSELERIGLTFQYRAPPTVRDAEAGGGR